MIVAMSGTPLGYFPLPLTSTTRARNAGDCSDTMQSPIEEFLEAIPPQDLDLLMRLPHGQVVRQDAHEIEICGARIVPFFIKVGVISQPPKDIQIYACMYENSNKKRTPLIHLHERLETGWLGERYGCENALKVIVLEPVFGKIEPTLAQISHYIKYYFYKLGAKMPFPVGPKNEFRKSILSLCSQYPATKTVSSVSRDVHNNDPTSMTKFTAINGRHAGRHFSRNSSPDVIDVHARSCDDNGTGDIPGSHVSNRAPESATAQAPRVNDASSAQFVSYTLFDRLKKFC